MLAWGMMAALWEAQRSGQGQVVDAAMTDGAAYLMRDALRRQGDRAVEQPQRRQSARRRRSSYGTYVCSDDKFVAIGPDRAAVLRALSRKMGIDDPDLADHYDPSTWPQQRLVLAAIFRTRTRRMVRAARRHGRLRRASVLDMDEAPEHPHNRLHHLCHGGRCGAARSAPRLSRTPAAIIQGARPPRR